MTITDIITAQNIGVSSGEELPTKHTLGASTSVYSLAVRVTLPATFAVNSRASVALCHATTPFDIAAADGPARLRHSCRRQPLAFPQPVAGKAYLFASDIEQAVGDKLHVWLETGVAEAALVADVKVVEY